MNINIPTVTITEQTLSQVEIAQRELLYKTDEFVEALLALEKAIRPIAEAAQELHNLVRKI